MLPLLLILFITWSCHRPESSDSGDLPRSTPEAEGVRSSSIIEFLDAVESGDQELHSIMYLRNGKVIAEGWWDPYRTDLKHTLYSTSKSFTSTAIGFAVAEGLLTVDDPVIFFFPEQLPDSVSPHLKAMTVKHLLTMSAGQDPPMGPHNLLPGESWVEAFLRYPVTEEPGTVFMYNSMATYMLSAIITQVTGQTVLEYLKPRLFEPLQIDGMDWETDPEGINSGGWGLRLKTEDMARFGQLYLQKGSWKGEQLLPESWIEEATSKQIDQAPQLSEEERKGNDWVQGYGYKFWRSQHGYYRGDGAFGQLIVVLEDKNAVIAVTAEARDMQAELNLIWDHLLPGLTEEQLEEDPSMLDALQKKLESLVLPAPDPGSRPPMQDTIAETFYVFDPGERNAVSGCTFNFIDKCCLCLITDTAGAEHTIELGMGEWIEGETMIPGPNLIPFYETNADVLLPARIASACSWKGMDTLALTVRYIESPHSTYYTFAFHGEKVTLQRSASMGLYRGIPAVSGKMRAN